MLPREIFFCFRKKSIILRPAVTVKVDGDEILKGQNNMAEEGIGKAADQRLFGAVNDKNNISKPGQGGIPALGKGHDLVTVLLGMTHIIKHRFGLAALADGKHHRGFAAAGQVMSILEEHIIVEMDIIEHHKAADGKPLRDVGADDIGETGTGGEHFLLAGGFEQPTEIIDEGIRVIINEVFEIFGIAAFIPAIQLTAEIIIQLAVPLKAQPLAHFYDGGGGDKIFGGDLLNADPFFPAFQVRGYTGDDLLLVFRKQIGK